MTLEKAPCRADLRPPLEVRRIARRLEDAGCSTWAVGGAVRDALVGRMPGDWDLTTAAHPGTVRKLFRRTVPVGVEHGTIGVLGRDGKMYEVTTFRRDVETFGRRARVVFADSIDEDLARRDFTFNAIAWHPVSGEIRDPFGGLADLARGVLRTVGEPRDRFAEDRLRVLRALRFAGLFDLTVDPATWEALCGAGAELGNLSAERVREELLKVLAQLPAPSASLRLYERSGVLAQLFPELAACVGTPAAGGSSADLWNHLLSTVDALPRHRLWLRVAALLHSLGAPAWRRGRRDGSSEQNGAAAAALARHVLHRLKCSNAQTDYVVHLVAQHTSAPDAPAADAELRKWLRRIGPEYLHDLLRLRIASCRAGTPNGDEQGKDLLVLARRARALLRTRPPLAISDLAIGGAELRRLGLPPGPRYGEILRELLDRVIEDPSLNTADALASLVHEMID